jgi:peptidoglycan/LPS O-acetylase OafA/YrhL
VRVRAPDIALTPPTASAEPGRRLAAVDGLRGLSALAIFVFHGWLYTMPGEPTAANRSTVSEYALHELRLGLVAFFVLSGFLLYRPWLKAALGDGPRPDVLAYARSRTARIAPAYYLALVGSIALLWGLSDSPGVRLPPAGELPLFAVFAQNFSPNSVMKLDPPMWSLTVEVTFYVLLPLVGLLAARLPRRRLAQAAVPGTFIAIGLAYNWYIAGRGLGPVASKTLPAMAAYFGAGMVAALLVHGRRPRARARGVLLGAGAAVVALDAALKASVTAGLLDVGDAVVILRDLPSAAGFAMLTAALSVTTRQGLLSSRAAVGLGTISYGFYLWHVPVLVFLRGHGLLPLDPVLGTLVALGPSLGLAALSWFALERPAMRWASGRNHRQRVARRRRLAARAATTASGSRDRRGGGREVGTVHV